MYWLLIHENNFNELCFFPANGSTILYLPEEKYLRHRNSALVVKPTVKEWLKEKARRGCTKKLVYKRVPILNWLPQYNTDFALADVLAGVTVGLTIIPQAIAYSNVAGLPPQIGLYSSFMACFVYTIFGNCKDSAIGPTAISGLLTRENNHGFGVDGAVLLCFLSGCVEFLMGVLQLGELIFLKLCLHIKIWTLHLSLYKPYHRTSKKKE